MAGSGSLILRRAIIHFLLRGGTNPFALIAVLASGVMGQDAFYRRTYIWSCGLVAPLLHCAYLDDPVFPCRRETTDSRRERCCERCSVRSLCVIVMSFVVLPISNTPKAI